MDQKTLVAAAVAGLFTLGAQGVAAQDKMQEKCWGVSKAGQNDCGSNKTAHSCAGQATKARDTKSFVLLPAGDCTKIQGGKTTAA